MTSSGTSTSTGSGGGGACQTLAPPPGEELPHVSVTGTTATAITQALDAIFASQAPPISPGQTYSIPTLDCRSVETPNVGSSAACTMEVAIDGGEPIPVSTSEASSARVLAFLDAFNAADSACIDPHGLNIRIKNMSVSPEAVEYDDRTKLDVFPAPNVVVRGMAAQNVVDAVAAAGINECGSNGKVRFICDTLSGGLSCSLVWWPTEKVGSSELIEVCGLAGPSLDPADQEPVPAAASPALWQSILAAAEEAGYQPLNGTLAGATVVNAEFFRWDGSSLSFRLVADNPGSPPPPPQPGG